METLRISDFPELIKPDLKLKDIQKIIKEKTGIKENNQRFHVYFDFLNFANLNSYDKKSFWENLNMKIYDKTKYITSLKRHFYEKNIILDLTKKIDELKKKKNGL